MSSKYINRNNSTVYVGSAAKVIRVLTKEEIESIRKFADNYVEVAKRY
ncbi:MAG: hypothetical protein RSB70_00715 [Clostridium sp.]